MIQIRVMTIDDYDKVIQLWRKTEGIGLSEADSETEIARYLELNPGFSFVACEGDLLVGAVLCGHDGRRGYVHHLAVSESHRGQGVGRSLMEHCLDALRSAGIQKCHLFVFADNGEAISFWQHIGWQQRTDLVVMSKYVRRQP